MLAASLKYIITIETSTVVQDLIGNSTSEWSRLGLRKANVIYGSGAKGFDSDVSADLNSSSVTFIFRHIANLTQDCRILFEGNTYTITSVEKLRRREGYKVITQRYE